MDNEKILKLASNCESCVTKPCQIGCPLNNDITTFIKYIKNEEFEKAYYTLTKTSCLMPLCGRICPHMQQCQGSCVKGVSYTAVEIGQLESIVGDMGLKNNWKIEPPKETKYNVAIIGGGPAGLTCAAFLRRNGIGVTIFEKYNYLGGLLVHGIPEFRLPKSIVKEVTDNILKLGINVKYGMELGENLSIEELKNNFDAIFIGIGANISNKMNIPGEDLIGVYGGNEILEHNQPIDYKDKTVIISGGGNVAMDISRVAKRSGAKKVIVIYRRSEKEMPADIVEIADAKKDGVEILFQTNILEINGDKKVNEIKVIKTELVKRENEERLSPVNIEGTEYTIPCDYVIMAVGSHSDEIVKKIDVEKNKNGRITIDDLGHTSDSKIFSGGDVAGVKGTVAWASRSGRNAAYAIIDYLK